MSGRPMGDHAGITNATVTGHGGSATIEIAVRANVVNRLVKILVVFQ
jgi:shikimate kinase